MRRRRKGRSGSSRGQRGISLLETLVALFILSLIAVTFLSGVTTASKATFTADEQSTAESLARSQMEWAKKVTYLEEATQYPPAPISDSVDYSNYSVEITAEPLHNPDDGIQKITVTVRHSGEVVMQLENYKRQR